jgi:hypothetical protein
MIWFWISVTVAGSLVSLFLNPTIGYFLMGCSLGGILASGIYTSLAISGVFTQTRQTIRRQVTVHPNKDGSVDEVLVFDADSDKPILHLEQMDANHYWLRIENETGKPALILDLVSARVPEGESGTRFLPSGEVKDADTRIRAKCKWDI